ncbi:MAG: indolepyruvate ferredoxin oxidoreductase subunit beta [Candidatus Saliniplasma sp.]
MTRTNLEIVGVGGQGILLSSQVLGKAALERDMDVYMSEVHGMAQRGGVVWTTVKIGDKVYSPLIGSGEADAVLSFEPIEAYRALEKASKDTWIVTNISPIVPFTVSVGDGEYPEVEEMFASLEEKTDRLLKIDAEKLAKEAGAAITQNIVMIGALTATDVLPVSKEEIIESIEKQVPEKFIEINKKAFELGYGEAKRQMNG